MSLSNKHRAFIENYLLCFNATEAYSRVYAPPSRETAASNGYRLLRNAEIAEIISQRLTETAMSADEVLMRLADHARADIGEFLAGDDGDVATDIQAMREKKKTHLIKKITQTRRQRTFRDDSAEEETVVSLELHDAQAALVHLGRHHKLFVDRTEFTGKDGKAIQIEYVNDWRSSGEN